MQIFPIILIAIVLAADGGLRIAPDRAGVDATGSTILAWGPIASILAVTWLGTFLCRRAVDRGNARRGWGGWPMIILAERFTNWARWLILLNHAAAVLAFGWLDTVRTVTGNLILIDELIVILPAVLGVLGTWWIQHPIERRLREALLIRRLDMGKPIHPMPGRGRFVMMQARGGLFLLLVPLLLIVGLAETIRMVGVRALGPDAPWWLLDSATAVAAISVFIIAPLLARRLLSVQPLPPGEVRDSLLNICRRHNVRVRDILLWNTSGTMINAAVMGLFGRLRYVLITDGLLETMAEEQVKAVMAHEVGHVRRHHMPWLVLTLIALIIATVWAIEAPLMAIQTAGVRVSAATADWLNIAITAAQVLIALIAFGWISRRFERQADTFAVQHLSGLGAAERPGAIQPAAVEAMQGALDTIAQLNAVDPNRHSWRHGSIAWRKQYLDALIGTPAHAQPIDALIRWIKRSAAVVLIVAGGAWAWMIYNGGMGTSRQVDNSTIQRFDELAGHGVLHGATIRIRDRHVDLSNC